MLKENLTVLPHKHEWIVPTVALFLSSLSRKNPGKFCQNIEGHTKMLKV